MRVRTQIIPEGDGLVSVFVKRTRRSEGPSILTQHVTQEELESTVDRMVRTVKNGGVDPTPERTE